MSSDPFQNRADAIFREAWGIASTPASPEQQSPDVPFQHIVIDIRMIYDSTIGAFQKLLSGLSLHEHVVLDFRHVVSIDEVGIGSIARLSSSLRTYGRKVFGVGVGGQVLGKIKTMKLSGGVIHLHDSLESAKKAMDDGTV